MTGSERFFDDFEKMQFLIFFWYFSKIFKNRSKVMLLTQTDLGNAIFMKKPSRLIPEKPIFDPRWPILWIFQHFYIFSYFLQNQILQKSWWPRVAEPPRVYPGYPPHVGGIPKNSYGFLRILRNSYEFLRIPWNSYEFLRILRNS